MNSKYGIEFLIPSITTVQIPSGEKSYIITIILSYKDIKWSLEKTSFNFNELFQNLRKLIPDLPQMPHSQTPTMEKYKSTLNQFLTYAFDRSDIINYFEFRQFFQLQKLSQEPVTTFQVTPIAHVEKFNYGVNEICYDKEDDIIFIGSTEQSTITESFFSNILLLNNNNYKSQLSIYKIIKNSGSYGDQKFEILLSEIFLYGITKIKYSNKKKILLISFDNGLVKIFNFFNYKLQILQNIKQNSAPIINFVYDLDKGYLYTIGKNEVFLTISEVNYNELVAKKNLCNTGIIQYEQNNDKIIVIDKDNSIWIFKIDTNSLLITMIQAIHTKTYNLPQVSTTTLFFTENYFFVGDDKAILLYEIIEDREHKKPTEIKKKLKFEFQSQCKAIHYNSEKKTLYSAHANGTLCIWRHFSNFPELVHQCNKNFASVNCFVYEFDNIIITGDDDKQVIMWKIPDQFFSEIWRVNKVINEEFVISNSLNEIGNTALANAFKFFANEGTNEEVKEEKKENSNEIVEEEDDGESSLDGWDEQKSYVLNTNEAPNNTYNHSGENMIKGIAEKYSQIKRITNKLLY